MSSSRDFWVSLATIDISGIPEAEFSEFSQHWFSALTYGVHTFLGEGEIPADETAVTLFVLICDIFVQLIARLEPEVFPVDLGASTIPPPAPLNYPRTSLPRRSPLFGYLASIRTIVQVPLELHWAFPHVCVFSVRRLQINIPMCLTDAVINSLGFYTPEASSVLAAAPDLAALANTAGMRLAQDIRFLAPYILLRFTYELVFGVRLSRDIELGDHFHSLLDKDLEADVALQLLTEVDCRPLDVSKRLPNLTKPSITFLVLNGLIEHVDVDFLALISNQVNPDIFAVYALAVGWNFDGFFDVALPTFDWTIMRRALLQLLLPIPIETLVAEARLNKFWAVSQLYLRPELAPPDCEPLRHALTNEFLLFSPENLNIFAVELVKFKLRGEAVSPEMSLGYLECLLDFMKRLIPEAKRDFVLAGFNTIQTRCYVQFGSVLDCLTESSPDKLVAGMLGLCLEVCQVSATLLSVWAQFFIAGWPPLPLRLEIERKVFGTPETQQVLRGVRGAMRDSLLEKCPRELFEVIINEPGGRVDLMMKVVKRLHEPELLARALTVCLGLPGDGSELAVLERSEVTAAIDVLAKSGKRDVVQGLAQKYAGSLISECYLRFLADAAPNDGDCCAILMGRPLSGELVQIMFDAWQSLAQLSETFAEVLLDLFMRFPTHPLPSPRARDRGKWNWAEDEPHVEPPRPASGSVNPWKVPDDLDLRCTFLTTGKHFVDQPWFSCFTCGLSTNLGVCLPCALTCHLGHDVRCHRNCSFFCGCFGAASGCCHHNPNSRPRLAISSAELVRFLIGLCGAALIPTSKELSDSVVCYGNELPFQLAPDPSITLAGSDGTVTPAWLLVGEKVIWTILNQVHSSDVAIGGHFQIKLTEPVTRIEASSCGSWAAILGTTTCYLVDCTRVNVLRLVREFPVSRPLVQWMRNCLFGCNEAGVVVVNPNAEPLQLSVGEKVANFAFGPHFGYVLTETGRLALLEAKSQTVNGFMERRFDPQTVLSFIPDRQILCASMPDGTLEFIHSGTTQLTLNIGQQVVFRGGSGDNAVFEGVSDKVIVGVRIQPGRVTVGHGESRFINSFVNKGEYHMYEADGQVRKLARPNKRPPVAEGPYEVPCSFWTLATRDADGVHLTLDSLSYSIDPVLRGSHVELPPESEQHIVIQTTSDVMVLVGFTILMSGVVCSADDYVQVFDRKCQLSDLPLAIPLRPEEVGLKRTFKLKIVSTGLLTLNSFDVYAVPVDKLCVDVGGPEQQGDLDWVTQGTSLFDFSRARPEKDDIFARLFNRLSQSVESIELDSMFVEVVQRIYSSRVLSDAFREIAVKSAVGKEEKAAELWAEAVRGVVEQNKVDDALWPVLWRDVSLLPGNVRGSVESVMWEKERAIGSVHAAVCAFGSEDESPT
jgi:hypothetical protein